MKHPARHSKIARLPWGLREEINLRLLNGESGRKVLAWLKALPEVRTVLAEDFGGRPINEPNLTAWRQDGYRDWLKEREARAVAERIGRDSLRMPEMDRREMTGRLANWVTGRYAVAAARVRDAESAEEHWRLLREMCADVVQLRRRELDEQRLELDTRRMDGEWGRPHMGPENFSAKPGGNPPNTTNKSNL